MWATPDLVCSACSRALRKLSDYEKQKHGERNQPLLGSALRVSAGARTGACHQGTKAPTETVLRTTGRTRAKSTGFHATTMEVPREYENNTRRILSSRSIQRPFTEIGDTKARTVLWAANLLQTGRRKPTKGCVSMCVVNV